MNLFKQTIAISLILTCMNSFSQVSIKQDISSDNGKLKIYVEKEEKGKKEIFDKTYNTEGMSQDQKQSLIDRVTDSLTAGTGKNMKMKVRVDRDVDEEVVILDNEDGNDNRNSDHQNKKKIIIKKNGKNINKSGDNEAEDLDFNFDFHGQDFDMHEFKNKMGDLGKTLQYKFDEFGPMMKKFGQDMEPQFRKFENGDYFNFGMNSSSKTVKSLNAYPNKPNNNKLNVKFTTPEKGNVTITVTDLNGKEIGKEKLTDFTGEYLGQIDLKGNSKGTVFVTVVQGDDGTVKRVVLN